MKKDLSDFNRFFSNLNKKRKEVKKMSSALCASAASLESSLNSLTISKKLLILDINEVLSRRIQNLRMAFNRDNVVSYTVFQSRHGNLRSEFKSNEIKRFIELRPGIKEFLKEIKSMNYILAIWSSTTYQNCIPTINALFSLEEQKNLFEFVWYRDRTRLDPEFGVNSEITNFDTVKNLEDVFSCPSFERRWNLSNTFIVDNSEKKLRFNPKENYFIVPSFDETNPSGEGLNELMEFLKNVEGR